jgi:hypothetical protein
MRLSPSRIAAIALTSLSVLALPTPAFATSEELHECWDNCYQAYVVITQQQAYYAACRVHCYDLYGDP